MNEKPIRILLVDDHKTVLWGLGKLIEGESPRMEIAGRASNREEAMQAAQATNPDVILLDVDLNGASSLEFLPDLLRAADCRVLILTGMRGHEIHEFATLQGASGVVMKEEPAETLLRAIYRVYEGEGEICVDGTTAGKVADRSSVRQEKAKSRCNDDSKQPPRST